MTLVFDIETDGFLEVVSKIHCLVIRDIETGEVSTYLQNDMETGLKRLMSKVNSDEAIAIGHNIIKYDIPVIQKIYNWFNLEPSRIVDTLVMSRLIFSDLRERDGAAIETGTLPSKLWASHSLKAWGYRLGIHKGDYGDDANAWEVCTPEMVTYCQRDTEVTQALYQKFKALSYSTQALDLEHETAWICAQMERNGWPFNKDGAVKLYTELVGKRAEILKNMQDTFEPLVIDRGFSEKTGKKLKDKVVEFNPGSRQQIAQRLTTKYGWKPKEFTPAGQAKVDEDVLKALSYPEAQKLAEYFLVEKRIGQVAEGEQAWLKLERNGKIHGSINTNGAVTGRATHNSPNLAQVPSVRAMWGKECRSFFTVRPGYSMCGSDLSGLELRCLGHFLSKWDNGLYIGELLNGDIHTATQKAAGLETRDQAKTLAYATLYGAGHAKIGSIVGGNAKDGKAILDRWMKAMPALKQLKDAVTKACERGYLIGLDGRRLAIRSDHAALNTLLQSAGALISKRWLIEQRKLLEAAGIEYYLLGWVHDEVVIETRPEAVEEVGKLVVEAAAKAGEYFDFRCPIGAEYHVGMTWADVH